MAGFQTAFGGPLRQQMRRIAAILVFVLSAGVLAQAQTEAVYVTKTGAKYHRAGCASLRSSSIPMLLATAAKRYGACLNCKPPLPAAPTTKAVAEAGAASTPPARAVTSGRCQATTKKGTQCSRNAKAGSSYCWQHGG